MGPETCAGYVGSFNHEKQDAATFAAWGIDFVEEDSCHHPTYPNGTVIPYHLLYARMRDALNATGRPMVFYSCVQGQDDVYQWGPATANLWRTTSDICAPNKATWGGVLHNFRGNALYPNVTGPGQWQVCRGQVEGKEAAGWGGGSETGLWTGAKWWPLCCVWSRCPEPRPAQRVTSDHHPVPHRIPPTRIPTCSSLAWLASRPWSGEHTLGAVRRECCSGHRGQDLRPCAR